MTDHQPLIDATPKLVAAVRDVEAEGGPAWPWWCDLEHMTISNVGPSDKMRCSPGSLVHCPPAVAAAVVDYQERMNEWLLRDATGRVSIHENYGFEIKQFGQYTWRFYDARSNKDFCGHTNDRTEAATALILAVAETIGDET